MLCEGATVVPDSRAAIGTDHDQIVAYFQCPSNVLGPGVVSVARDLERASAAGSHHAGIAGVAVETVYQAISEAQVCP